MTRFITLLFLIIASFSIQAQTVADALRFSYLEVGGSARSVGAGGSISAFGADYSTLSVNPAGLAAFRRSEMVITPSLFISYSNSTLEGSGNDSYEEKKSRFNFNNIGIIFQSTPRKGKWKTFNVGIGFNRLANFNKEIFYSGASEGSITDRYVELATGLEPSELDGFEAGLAYQTGAIYDPDPNNTETTEYISDIQMGTIVDKQQSFFSSGTITEMVISFAGNYEEKLMIGATIGVPFLSYNESINYTETDDSDQIPIFNELNYIETLRISGVGINFKLGLIYRLSQMVRLGLAAHSPTGYGMTDTYASTLSYDFTINGGDNFLEENSPDGTFDYKLQTPWRLVASSGFLFQRLGFVTAEVEWVDYSAANFNLTPNAPNQDDKEYERQLNNEIGELYKSAINIRLGGEYAYKIFRFRAGYGINGTPYAGDNSINSSFSLGAGVREQGYYVDLAYKRSKIEETFVPYRTLEAVQQRVSNSFNNDKFMLTLGLRF